MKTKDTGVLTTAVKWIVAAGVASSLAACGGSSDTVGAAGGAGTTTTNLSILGTAATGVALSGATVTVTCVSGTGTATSNANGTYGINVVNGQGPCLLTATLGSVVLHSITPGSGTANITPLTDLLTTYLATQAGTTPANLLSTANGKAIIGSSSTVTSAEAAIASLIQADYGVTLSSSNFLTAAITPPGSGATQSATDVDLDSLVAANVVNSSGGVIPNVAATVTTSAQSAPPFVAPTGATGG